MLVGDLVYWEVFVGEQTFFENFEYGIVTDIKESSYRINKAKKKKKIVTVFSDGIVMKFFCHELKVIENQNEL